MGDEERVKSRIEKQTCEEKVEEMWNMAGPISSGNGGW